jgi:hypothetical protein
MRFEVSSSPFQRPQPDSSGILKIKPSSYSGKEKESLRRWFVEIDTVIIARKLSSLSQMVAFALSCLAGNARAWGYNLLIGMFSPIMTLLSKSFAPSSSPLEHCNVQSLNSLIYLKVSALCMNIY